MGFEPEATVNGTSRADAVEPPGSRVKTPEVMPVAGTVKVTSAEPVAGISKVVCSGNRT
jgi:hypothetical protein